MDRQMEPSSQMFTQGGIRSRDWFSDRLGQRPGRCRDRDIEKDLMRQSGGRRWGWGRPRRHIRAHPSGQGLPVESIAHLDGHQHRQGHGHGLGGLKHLTVQAIEFRVVLSALHEMSLQKERQKPEHHRSLQHALSGPASAHPQPPPYQLMVADMRPILCIQEPPGSCSHSGCTHVACGGEKRGAGVRAEELSIRRASHSWRQMVKEEAHLGSLNWEKLTSGTRSGWEKVESLLAHPQLPCSGKRASH